MKSGLSEILVNNLKDDGLNIVQPDAIREE